jgi:hypothetical protein
MRRWVWLEQALPLCTAIRHSLVHWRLLNAPR